MNLKLTSIATALAVPTLIAGLSAGAPATPVTKSVLVDIGHGQKFWNDPARMQGSDPSRARYLGDQLKKTTADLGADFEYVAEPLTAARLATGAVLFIHVPTKPYTKVEVAAIDQFIRGGGSLFIVMEDNYWSRMEDTNVNDITRPFGIAYDGLMSGEESGGHTLPGLITDQTLRVPYEGGRRVSGGTPFVFTNEKEPQAFGVFATPKGGGRVIAMGDGMVALYMNSWQGVTEYQCQDFMHSVLGWLLQ